jgi:hypothetical protein
MALPVSVQEKTDVVRCFFITGQNRSGSTLVQRILNEASNARVFEELSPKMGYEAREKHEGHFPSREAAKTFIKTQKNEHIKLVNEMGFIFGDKNANYIPFLTEMAEVWPEAKFVILIRDGRDVVTSWCNFQTSTGKNVFQMAEDRGEGGTLFPVCDLWDYSRLRPRKGEEFRSEWQNFDVFTKSCFSWSYTNGILFDALGKISRDRWVVLNVSAISTAIVKGVYDFLGLQGFDKERIDALLQGGVNESRVRVHPKWPEWADHQKRTYETFCSAMHQKLFGGLNWT